MIILRLKNAMNLDMTAAQTLKELATILKKEGRTLLICGATPHVQKVLEESGASQTIGTEKILIAQKTLHDSTRQAMKRACQQIASSSDKEDEQAGKLTFTLAQQQQNQTEATVEEPIEEEKTGHHSNYDFEG